jgi:hypothetical protein
VVCYRVTFTFIFYIHQSVCLCDQTRLPVDLFSWNFILGIFTTIYVPDSVLVKIGLKLSRHIAWRPVYVPSDVWPFTRKVRQMHSTIQIQYGDPQIRFPRWVIMDETTSSVVDYNSITWRHIRYMRFLMVWRDKSRDEVVTSRSSAVICFVVVWFTCSIIRKYENGQ